MIRTLLVFLAALAGTAQAQEVLHLQDALDLALQNNYAIQLARNEVAIAANDYAPGNAGYLPTVDFAASYGGTVANTTQQFLSGQTNEARGAVTRRTAAGLGLRWTAFDGFGRNATYDRLGGLLEQEQTRETNTTEQVITDITVVYYDIARQQQQVRVLEEAVAISQERLRIAELRRDLGSASELEVRQARLDLNTDRAALLRQQTALLTIKADFNQLLVRPLALDYTVVDSIDVGMMLPETLLLEETLARNATLQLARQAQSIARIEIREIRAEALPSVDLTAGLNYSDLSAEAGFLLNNRTDDVTYGVSLNLNIFDGFNRRRRVENAQIRLRNAELVIEDIRTALQTDISRAYANYLNSLELIALEEENLTLARQNVEVALERFELGTITSIELREVQETLTRAQSLLLTAQFEAKRAETELRRLSGRLLDPQP